MVKYRTVSFKKDQIVALYFTMGHITGLGLEMQFMNGILNFSSLCAQYNSVKESKNEGGWVGLFVLQFLLFFKSEFFEF